MLRISPQHLAVPYRALLQFASLGSAAGQRERFKESVLLPIGLR